MSGALDDAQARLQQRRRKLGIAQAPEAHSESAAPEPQHDGVEDALETLLPEGAEVAVSYIDECRKVRFRREMWIVRLRIADGEHAGRLVTWWLRALDRGRPVARGSSVAASFSAATGLRPPRDLARRRPSYWLSDALFRVSTRQVRKDVHGIARPETASYSVVVAILERLAGAPPALRERTR